MILNIIEIIKYLGLNKCHLTNLDNLPQIPTLKRLTLDFNQISSLNLGFYNDTLVSLSVMGNCLNLEGECAFTQMTALKQLSVLGNNYNDYSLLRQSYLEQMPNLLFLDGLKRDEEQRTVLFRNQQEEARYLGWYKLKTPTLNLKDDSIEIVPKKKTKKKKDQTVRFSLGSRSNKKKRVKVEEPDSQQGSPYGKIEQSQSEHHVKTEFTLGREIHQQQLGSQINTIDFDMVNQIHDQVQNESNNEENSNEAPAIKKKIKKTTQSKQQKKKEIEISDVVDSNINSQNKQDQQLADNLQTIQTSQQSPKQKNVKILNKNIQIKQEAIENSPKIVNDSNQDVQFIGQGRNKKSKQSTPHVKQEDKDSFVQTQFQINDAIQASEVQNPKSQAKIKRPKQLSTPKKSSSEADNANDQSINQGKISEQSSGNKSNIRKPRQQSKSKIEEKNLREHTEIQDIPQPPQEKQYVKKETIKTPKQALHEGTSMKSPEKDQQQESPQTKKYNKKSKVKKGTIKSKTQDTRSKPEVIKTQKSKVVQSESDDSRSKSLSPVPRRSSRPKKSINYFGQA